MKLLSLLLMFLLIVSGCLTITCIQPIDGERIKVLPLALGNTLAKSQPGASGKFTKFTPGACLLLKDGGYNLQAKQDVIRHCHLLTTADIFL